VHDYFHILGVSRDARASEIRRACCRHVRPAHPDIWDGDRSAGPRAGVSLASPINGPGREELSDASVNFVEMTGLVDRVLASFFQDPSHTPNSTHK